MSDELIDREAPERWVVTYMGDPLYGTFDSADGAGRWIEALVAKHPSRRRKDYRVCGVRTPIVPEPEVTLTLPRSQMLEVARSAAIDSFTPWPHVVRALTEGPDAPFTDAEVRGEAASGNFPGGTR